MSKPPLDVFKFQKKNPDFMKFRFGKLRKFLIEFEEFHEIPVSGKKFSLGNYNQTLQIPNGS